LRYKFNYFDNPCNFSPDTILPACGSFNPVKSEISMTEQLPIKESSW